MIDFISRRWLLISVCILFVISLFLGCASVSSAVADSSDLYSVCLSDADCYAKVMSVRSAVSSAVGHLPVDYAPVLGTISGTIASVLAGIYLGRKKRISAEAL